MKDNEKIEHDPANYPDYVEKVFEFRISGGQKPERLDKFLTRSITNASRTKVQKAIQDGTVSVNGDIVKPSYKICPGDHVLCKILKPPPIQLVPEDIPLDIKYEDDDLLVVNKPAGMVTHPGYGNRYGTLVNALLYHLGHRESIDVESPDDDEDEDNEDFDEGSVFSDSSIRPGIVHRLDKDTSGLLVIAKNTSVHTKLQEQFADRTIERFYYAIVWGRYDEDSGTYEGNIGRSPRDRKLFSVVKRSGKPAYTDFEVIGRYEYAALVKIKLRTGRTHQIRVHFSHNNHPVFGDNDYGGDKLVHGGHNKKWRDMAYKALKIADRQMLHAKILGFNHPVKNEFMRFESELPEDMKQLNQILKI